MEERDGGHPLGGGPSFAEAGKENDVPSDGLVLLYDDIAYGESLGRTAKFPRDSIAFKWADEIQETHPPVYRVERVPDGADQPGWPSSTRWSWRAPR